MLQNYLLKRIFKYSNILINVRFYVLRAYDIDGMKFVCASIRT